jgi:S23 ribosomal protein.
MKRAAVSIPSNIAEGRSRGTRKDFVQFLRISLGSTAELETQVEIAKKIPTLNEYSYEEIDILLTEISKMLVAMIKKLQADS